MNPTRRLKTGLTVTLWAQKSRARSKPRVLLAFYMVEAAGIEPAS